MHVRPAAICVVQNTKGEVLAVSRDRLDDLAFPGGEIEDGETPAAAAARELNEETWVRGKDLVLLFATTSPDRPRRTVHVFRAGDWETNHIVAEPHTVVAWVQPERLLEPSCSFASFAREHFAQIFGRAPKGSYAA